MRRGLLVALVACGPATTKPPATPPGAAKPPAPDPAPPPPAPELRLPDVAKPLHNTVELTIDPASLGPAPRRIVANLPYNISTPLLVRWLQQADAIADMVLMFQKEVVDRLVATPRTKDYGRLSVLAQHVCEIRRLFDIPAAAFVPPPKVTSSVARLTPRPASQRLADLAPLEKVTAAAFGQRRKMLRGALSRIFADPVATLEGIGLSPTARAEELSVADFITLAESPFK